MPYLMQLTPQAFAQLRIPLPAFIALQGMQALVLLGLLSLLGLRMGHPVGLGSPLLQGWLARRDAPHWRELRPLQAVALGVAAAVLVLGVQPGAGSAAAQAAARDSRSRRRQVGAQRLVGFVLWRHRRGTGVAAVPDDAAGVVAGPFGRRQPPAAAYWVAIVVAAVLFGAGHLPAAAKLWGLTDIVVFRTIAAECHRRPCVRLAVLATRNRDGDARPFQCRHRPARACPPRLAGTKRMKREFAVVAPDRRLTWLLPGVSAVAALLAIGYAARRKNEPRLWLLLLVLLA